MAATEKQPIIIVKRIKKVAAGHHGGAWKVAYADFVTAMMAFFLLMWLLNVTSVEQKQGIASYFSPLSLPNPPSSKDINFDKEETEIFQEFDEKDLETDNQEARGPEEAIPDRIVSLEGRKQTVAGQVGKLPEKKSSNNLTELGLYRQKTAEKIKVTDDAGVLKKEPLPTNTGKYMDSGVLDEKSLEKKELKPKHKKIDKKDRENPQEKDMAEKEKQRVSQIQGYAEEKKKFDEIAKSLKQAIQDIPELKKLSQNLVVDMAEEGLRIQILDKTDKPMFNSGSAVLTDETKKIINLIGKSISNLKNKISISGHTDSIPYRGNAIYSNWELSSDRAHASRKALAGSSIDPQRIVSVVGKEDKEPLFPDKPNAPENRRISITVLFDKKSPINIAEPLIPNEPQEKIGPKKIPTKPLPVSDPKLPSPSPIKKEIQGELIRNNSSA